MANVKTSEYTTLAGSGVASGDLVEVVDVSDTTDAASGTNKKVTLSSLGGMHLIETISNVSAGDFDFNSIPQGFNRLIIIGNIRGDVTSTSDGVRCYFNADTTASNYHTNGSYANNGTTTTGEGDDPFVGPCPADSSPSGAYGFFKIEIEDYADSSLLKQLRSSFVSYLGADSQRTGVYSVVSSVTAAITRVRVQTDNDPTDQLLGTMRLYGQF